MHKSGGRELRSRGGDLTSEAKKQLHASSRVFTLALFISIVQQVHGNKNKIKKRKTPQTCKTADREGDWPLRRSTKTHGPSSRTACHELWASGEAPGNGDRPRAECVCVCVCAPSTARRRQGKSREKPLPFPCPSKAARPAQPASSSTSLLTLTRFSSPSDLVQASLALRARTNPSAGKTPGDM